MPAQHNPRIASFQRCREVVRVAQTDLPLHRARQCDRWVVQHHDRSVSIGRGQDLTQPREPSRADPAVHLTRDQAVQGDDFVARCEAHRGSPPGPVGQQAAGVPTAGVQVTAAQAGRKGLAVVVVPGAEHRRHAALLSEATNQGPGDAVAPRRAVLGDVAAHHDQVHARQMPAVVQQLLEDDTSVDAVGIRSAVTREVAVGQVQDPHVQAPIAGRGAQARGGVRRGARPHHGGDPPRAPVAARPHRVMRSVPEPVPGRGGVPPRGVAALTFAGALLVVVG